MMRPTFHHGDCLEVLRTLPAHSVDAIVTDPPYSLSFMGRAWDTFTPSAFQVFCQAWAAECLRVVKPGGHLVSFGGTRTSHRLACGIEDAGWAIRDTLLWVHAQGFPKSLDLSKEMDRRAGVEREVIGLHPNPGSTRPRQSMGNGWQEAPLLTAPATDLAAQWDGWGTALKPAQEPIVLARAPLSESSVAANVARWGTGGLNIAASRIGTADTRGKASLTALGQTSGWNAHANREVLAGSASGRWPTNLVFSHSLWCTADGCADGCPVAELDAQSGISTSTATMRGFTGRHDPGQGPEHNRIKDYSNSLRGHEDAGGASRFFPVFAYDADDLPWLPFYYTPKPDRAERDKGCAALPQHTSGELTHRADGSAGLNSPRAGAGRTSGGRNTHPTIKPQALMRWLCRLITPLGGVVLDPFGGSGSTIVAADQCGFAGIYIDQDADYLAIAIARFVGDAPLFHSERPA